MRRRHLPVLVLQDVTHRALQHAGTPATARVESARVLAQLVAAPTSLDADHPPHLILQERVKQADRIRTTADTRDERVRQTAFGFENLFARLAADDALKLAHHQRVWMWSKRS